MQVRIDAFANTVEHYGNAPLADDNSNGRMTDASIKNNGHTAVSKNLYFINSS